MELRYRSPDRIVELCAGECTVRGTAAGARCWWQLWCRVRYDDGSEHFVGVPVIPHGAYHENGAGGRTWGLTRVGPGRWQVSPSIDVLSDDDARRLKVGQPRRDQSLWHQTPALVGVPDGEPWQ